MGDYLKEATAGESLPEYKILQHGEILDQGNEGTCVGHAWVAWNNCRPRGYRNQLDHEDALAWYDRATELDPWPDNDHDRQSGTSTQAGVEVAIEWDLGESYVWAETLETMSAFIRLRQGPIVLGTYWYESMYEPRYDGIVLVDTGSGMAGGHEWLTFGVKEGFWHCQNSWGEDWADDGVFYLSDEDMAKLLYRGGDAVAIVQTGVVPG